MLITDLQFYYYYYYFFFFLRIYLWRPENRGRIQQTVIIIIKHFKPEEGTRQGIEGEGTKYFLEG